MTSSARPIRGIARMLMESPCGKPMGCATAQRLSARLRRRERRERRRWSAQRRGEFRLVTVPADQKRSIADDRDFEPAARELRLHPTQFIRVVVRTEANAVTNALVR